MCASVIRLCFLFVLLLLLPVLLSCQTQPGNVDLSKLTDSVSKLSEQIKGLEESVKTSVKQEDLDTVKADVRMTKADMRAVIETVADANVVQGELAIAVRKDLPDKIAKVSSDLTPRVAKLESDLDVTKSALAATNAVIHDQNEILAQISKSDRSGNHIVALGDLRRNSPDFKREFDLAVKDSVHREPQYGTLRVKSNMSFGYVLRVNGVNWSIPAFGYRDISVPLGAVTTELVGYESPKNWWIGSPDYVRRIIIKPQPVPLAPIVWSSPNFTYVQ